MRTDGETEMAKGEPVVGAPQALQLHGRYLGYIRQLKPRARAQVKALREKKGVRVAIARARKLAAA